MLQVVLDEAKLQELGGDRACSVCTEDLAVGDEVQLLPCRHSYHPDCLAPWLKVRDSALGIMVCSMGSSCCL